MARSVYLTDHSNEFPYRLARILHKTTLTMVRVDEEDIMGRGSTGNVIAALCSFFIPGLGQLLQGRWVLAGFMFVMTILLWVILLGWIIHLWSIIDAALYTPADSYRPYRSYGRGRRYDW